MNFENNANMMFSIPADTIRVLRMVVLERLNQVMKGRTPDMDDAYDSGELGSAAVAMLLSGAKPGAGYLGEVRNRLNPSSFWPAHWGILPLLKVNSYQEGLVKSIAMLVAELERHIRADREKEVSKWMEDRTAYILDKYSKVV